MDFASMHKRRVGVTARSRQIVGSQATGSVQVATEMAAPLAMRTPTGTAAKAANRVRMEVWRQRRESQLADIHLVANGIARRGGRQGAARCARMRRCLILRQGASPLRPPAPFPCVSSIPNGGNLSRVRKPRPIRAPLTDSLRSETVPVMRERGPADGGGTVPARLPLVGPDRKGDTT